MTSSEKPIILLTALFVIGFLFVVFYLILPACYNADGLFFQMDTYKSKEAELATLQSYHKSILDTRDELKAAGWDEMRNKISINLTRNDPMFLPKIYSFFEQECTSTGPKLNSVIGSRASVMKGEAQTSASLKENQFNLSISSSYDTFKTFLADLENQALLIDVKEIGFSSITPAEPTKKGELVSGVMPFSLVLTVPSY